MKFRKVTAILIAVVMSIIAIPFPTFAKDDVSFTLSSSLAEGEKPNLGDTVTYTIGISENSGFCIGTMFFKPSSGLAYVSSTLLGKDYEASQAVTGSNQGAWGIMYMLANYSMTTDNFCTITFRVDDLENISVEAYGYDFRHSSDLVNPLNTTITPSQISHSVETPGKPIISTTTLKKAVLDKNYSFILEADQQDYISWELTSGALPEGLQLLDDGTISGTPTEFGDFNFGVTASILNAVSSDEVQLTLTVLEKPKELELSSESKYTAEEGYLNKVVERTTYTDFIDNFENTDFIKIFDGDGNEVTDPDAFIGTGFTVSLMDGNEAAHSLTVVVLGDTNGDGKLGASDYYLLKSHCLNKYDLEGAYLLAAHVSKKTSVGASDYYLLKSHCLNKYNIYA